MKVSKDEKISGPFLLLQKTAERVASIMEESKITIDKEEYILKFKPDLMEVAYKWCQGSSFKEICEVAEEVFEGTIIRGLRRLDELLSQLVEASKIIGNVDLKIKFEESQKSLKRGIVFTASLYL
jgi:ATP-dependent RNA helicase DOB1